MKHTKQELLIIYINKNINDESSYDDMLGKIKLIKGLLIKKELDIHFRRQMEYHLFQDITAEDPALLKLLKTKKKKIKVKWEEDEKIILPVKLVVDPKDLTPYERFGLYGRQLLDDLLKLGKKK